MRRGTIFAGDLATAIAALDADDAVAEKIAELLGVAPPPAAAPLPGRELPILYETPLPPMDTAVDSISDTETSTFLPSRIERLSERRVKQARVSFRSEGTLPPASSEEHEPAPPFEPLLRNVTSRAIVSHALATRRVTGLDVEKIVERIARRDRLDPLPLRLVATMRRGVQLLVDASTGMTLFRRDQSALTDWIGKVVGRDRVTIASFIGTPRIRFFGSTGRAKYAPPTPQTPVVLLTDLGIARPRRLDNSAGIAEWLEFAEQLRRARCPAIVFVPYPRARCPWQLRRAFTILEWDRALTASRARRRR